MTSQHYSDARTELTARVMDHNDTGFSPDEARELAASFITWLLENGWAPHVVVEPRGQHRPADPAKVHSIVEKFKAEQEARAAEQGEPA